MTDVQFLFPQLVVSCFEENLCVNVSLYLNVYFKMTFTSFTFWKPSSYLFILQVLSGIALWSYKVAKAPKDKEHPYGHSWFVPTRYSINLNLCIYSKMFYCHLLLVVMCVVKYDRDLFCWQCFCNYTIVFLPCFSFRTW